MIRYILTILKKSPLLLKQEDEATSLIFMIFRELYKQEKLR